MDGGRQYLRKPGQIIIIMENKVTKGNFKDGTTGWKVDSRETNGVKGFEIHYSDDGECVTDHVYEEADAKLIAAAPELLQALSIILEELNNLDVFERMNRLVEPVIANDLEDMTKSAKLLIKKALE